MVGITMKQVQKILIELFRNQGVNFTFNERFVSLDDVFSEVGLMPSIVKRADSLAHLCMNYGLGARYEEDPSALFKEKVIFDDSTPNAIRILCIMDVLFDFVVASPSSDQAALDDLMRDV